MVLFYSYISICLIWACFSIYKQSQYSIPSTIEKYLLVFFINFLLMPAMVIYAILEDKIFTSTNDEEIDKYTVVYRDKPVYKINAHLVEVKNISDDELNEIKKVHVEKLTLFEKMENTDDPHELKFLALGVEELEFKLQELWKFNQDANFHRWWEVPKCVCSNMDNEDRYGTNYRVINEKCPIHGNIK